MEMSRLTRDGTAEPVSRDQILRHARGQGNIIFPVQLATSRIGNFTRLIHTLLYVMTIHTYIHTPQPLKPSLSSPPLCQTPGCRSGRNRSTLSPSHPVLSVLHPQGFRKRFTSVAARRSFAGASPPTKVFSFATSSQCSHTRLSQGHGCTKSSDGLVSCAVPR